MAYPQSDHLLLKIIDTIVCFVCDRLVQSHGLIFEIINDFRLNIVVKGLPGNFYALVLSPVLLALRLPLQHKLFIFLKRVNLLLLGLPYQLSLFFNLVHMTKVRLVGLLQVLNCESFGVLTEDLGLCEPWVPR